jgi:threonylcarbamoyladenosine tRNA methylthiotransferase MtaB
MRFSVITFGCRVNQADSSRVEEALRLRGGVDASAADADLVVVNTCSVTATADQGARQTIRRIARDNPAARIVVTGCYATRRRDEVAALPNVLRVITNDLKDTLVDRLFDDSGAAALGAPLTTAERYGTGDGACGSAIAPGLGGRTAFTLRVQTGCEDRCSYCIIPSTRGRGRSLPVDAVVAEVGRIAASGFKEIAMTGVHLGSYGRDLNPSTSLVELLRALESSAADVVFRISSLEPMDCRADIINVIVASGGRFAPHFHLPLQHASDPVLSRMRRPYVFDDYSRLVDNIVGRLPHASIGTDMIVGFPGETDDDFAVNMEQLPRLPLSHLHVFPYSDRPGTEAAAMPDRVDGPVVRERGARLREIGASMTRRFRQSQVGSIRPALTIDDGTVAVTDNYLKVRIPAGKARNERILVRIAEDGGVLCGVPQQS